MSLGLGVVLGFEVDLVWCIVGLVVAVLFALCLSLWIRCRWFCLDFGAWMRCGLDLCAGGCVGGCLLLALGLDLLASCLTLAD